MLEFAAIIAMLMVLASLKNPTSNKRQQRLSRAGQIYILSPSWCISAVLMCTAIGQVDSSCISVFVIFTKPANLNNSQS